MIQSVSCFTQYQQHNIHRYNHILHIILQHIVITYLYINHAYDYSYIVNGSFAVTSDDWWSSRRKRAAC